jgi:hypothetical protein
MAASAYFPPLNRFSAILCGAAPTHGRIGLFFPRSTVFRPRFRVATPTYGRIRLVCPAQPFFGRLCVAAPTESTDAWPHPITFPPLSRISAIFTWQHRRGSASAHFSPLFGHFTWQRRRKAPTRGTDGAMYTHGHVHEGAPLLKTLPP